MFTVFALSDRFVATGGAGLAFIAGLAVLASLDAAFVITIFAAGLGFDAAALAGESRTAER
ncbi:MAG: hypothetical protein AB1813_11330 [Verrucomicrobiota bacterium]